MWGAPHARRARLSPTCLQCLQCLLCRSHGWLHISRSCFSRPPLPLVSMFLAALHWLSIVTGAWCWVVTGSPWIPPRWVGTPFGGPSITRHLPPRSSVDEFTELHRHGDECRSGSDVDEYLCGVSHLLGVVSEQVAEDFQDAASALDAVAFAWEADGESQHWDIAQRTLHP